MHGATSLLRRLKTWWVLSMELRRHRAVLPKILRPTLMMLYSTLSAMLKSLTLCLLVRWTFALHVALMQAWTLMLLTILMHMRIVISITRT
jgi:hypothetical protein